MDFPKWLQAQLDERGWLQSDLARHATMAGYKLSSGQLSYILSGERGAGPEACIAIAYALGISRDEVFRARGWLLREAEPVVPPSTAPEVANVARRLQALPANERAQVAQVIEGILNLFADGQMERDLALLGTGDPELWDKAHREVGIPTPPRGGRDSSPPVDRG